MANINRPKGTEDILPGESEKWAALEARIRKVCRLYNFKEIRTPIFESGNLFHRDQNDVSDMVTKETYDFKDRGDRDMTLRPEGTAGVARSFVEQKLYVDSPVSKLFYMGPMFRYERAQKGRQRQFHQFGIEALGSASPMMDAEVIATAVAVIKEFGLTGVKVKINTIGDEESRSAYKNVLVNYFKAYEDDLCPDCKNRLYKNPLRILDCKVDRDKDYFIKAPKISSYLNEPSKEHFASVLDALKAMGIEYEIDENLVRGLDYYTHTVFEVEVDVEELGHQNVICAGGRYNNLIKQIGGPDTPACGLAFGMERLLIALDKAGVRLVPEFSSHLFIIAMGDNAIKKSSMIMNKMRMGGLVTEMDYNNKGIKGQFKLADKNNALFTAIMGDNELQSNTVNLKNNETDEQEAVLIDELYDYILDYLKGKSCSHCGNCKGE